MCAEKSRSEIINSVIDRVIDSLLRKSYVECFDKLASRFEAGTLKGFANWKKFVEFSQRRNLITHCGGIVSQQYLDICKEEQVDVGDLQPWQKISVTQAYLFEAIEVVVETGLKIGQVLWRSLRKSSIYAADVHLSTNLLFELLKREQWIIALRLGEFGQECAKRRYAPPRSERLVKIIIVNHAQAAKWSGDNEMAMKIIDGTDWSGSSLDFLLAVACLKDDWKKAAEIMRELGNVSELVGLHAYYNWPIFRVFRETEEFLTMFKQVFGVKFAEDLKGKGDGSIDPTKPSDTSDAET